MYFDLLTAYRYLIGFYKDFQTKDGQELVLSTGSLSGSTCTCHKSLSFPIGRTLKGTCTKLLTKKQKMKILSVRLTPSSHRTVGLQ